MAADGEMGEAQSRAPLSTVGISVVIPSFKNSLAAATAALAMQQQEAPPGVPVEVIIVDDGSGPSCIAAFERSLPAGVNLVALPRNLGRAGARNAGARAAKGGLLVFMDSDCMPLTSDFLKRHMPAFGEAEVCASTGPVLGEEGHFWARHQRRSSEARRRQHHAGRHFAGSTGNLVVRRSAFEACGGFDPRYIAYGFEDRDLLIRLGHHGRIVWCETAAVVHRSPMKLPEICTKMAEAGRESAPLFAARHPQEYAALGYARIDGRNRLGARLLARVYRAAFASHLERFDRALHRRWIPHSALSLLVKLLQAGAYAAGTLEPPRATEERAQRSTQDAL